MIEGLKPYADYKQSDLVWLQSLPEKWMIRRGRGVFECVDKRSIAGSEQLLSVSAADGVRRRSEKAVTMFQAASYAGHKLAWPGDLVINSLWAWMKGLGFSKHHGIVSTAYGVYRLRPEHREGWRYLNYLLRSNAYDWELRVRSKGIWTSRMQLTDWSFLDMPILLPPPDEQAAIVRFLDHANRKIDRFIRAKRKLIALLNEQKQAIIHSTVTRGTDLDAPLKPSGFAAIGDLPAHWNVREVRRLCSLVTSGSRSWANFYSEDGLIFIQSGNLGRSMSLNFSYTQHVRPPHGAEGERTKVLCDDVLLCITGALTGNVVHVDAALPGPSFVNQHVALIRPRSELIAARYLAYALHSRVGQSQFKTSEYGGTKQGLGLFDVKSACIPLPPPKEQQAIVLYLDRALRKFDEAIARAEREISLMQEYRTRLTADIVTGKLDVREAAARLPELDESPVDEAIIDEPDDELALEATE